MSDDDDVKPFPDDGSPPNFQCRQTGSPVIPSSSAEEHNTSMVTSHPDDEATCTSSGPLDGTPSKRNKRKMTEPRRRTTDFSIRSICSNSDPEDANDDLTAEDTHRRLVTPLDDQSHSSSKQSPLIIPHYIPAVSNNAFRFSFTGLPQPCVFPMGMMSNWSPLFAAPVVVDPSVSSLAAAARLSGCPITPINSTTDVKTTLQLSVESEIDVEDSPEGRTRESPDSPGSSIAGDDATNGSSLRRSRKNYKNMTKQRRIEANARERTRVHTISAAFESLRRAVPSYSHNQRLSKLAILRIACSYILALASLADLDYTEKKCAMTFGECVDLCTQTIQAEGKAKRKH